LLIAYYLNSSGQHFYLLPCPVTNQNFTMTQTSNTAGPLKNLLTAILLTGFVAGTLDGLTAVINYMSAGKENPEIIFKYIASGVFGKKAYAGGTGMILWGVLFHFLISYGLTVFYFWLYPKVKWLGENKVAAGLLYGVFAWVVTTRLIIPLSLIPQQPFNIYKAIMAIQILMLCIGLPISLMANKHYLYKK
jgi:hypothetical protein